MDLLEFRQINGHKLACALTEPGQKKIVVFCHGFRGTSTGPNRFFVTAARKLAEHGISSIRFDQYGSGNSEGDFMDSSFNDWVATTKAIAQKYLDAGYQVCLLGQSMGGSTVIVAGEDLSGLRAVVAWTPAAMVHSFVAPPEGFFEESGQRVRARFWKEAHNARIADKLSGLKVPTYIVQCSDDEYVLPKDRQAINSQKQPQHVVEMYEGYKHSLWTFEAADKIINKSVDFIVNSLS